MMMDEEERERRRAHIEEARDLLRDLDAAAALRAASSSLAETEWESDRNDHLYRYGIALANPGGLERWRRREAEQLEATRNREKMMTDAEQAKWVDRRIAAALAEHARTSEEAD